MSWAVTRRGALGGLVGGVVASGSLARSVPRSQSDAYRGLQLYTVRSAFAADPLATLTKVRAIGYRSVETAGLAGHSAREVRAMLDSIGLRARSGHVSPDDWYTRPDAALDEIATLGAAHAVYPWVREEERKDWPAFGAKLNGFGEKARARGLRLAYHNHDFEFARETAGLPYDLLLAHTDPALVGFELDVYWATHAGRNPLALIEAHQGRISLLHLKDSTAAGKMAPVGAGTIDFPRILAAAARTGVDVCFVEQDDAADPYASAATSLAWLNRHPVRA